MDSKQSQFSNGNMGEGGPGTVKMWWQRIVGPRHGSTVKYKRGYLIEGAGKMDDEALVECLKLCHTK